MKTNFITRPKAYKNHLITKPPAGTQIDWTNSLSRGLVGCWLFNEGSGLKVNDLSGNNNHGTLTNFEPMSATSGWTGGKNGNALAFDGVDDCISIPDSSSLDISAKITLEAWVYPVESKTQAILWRDGGVIGDRYLQFYLSATNKLELILWDSINASHGVTSAALVPLNVWTHVVAVYDGATMYLYINGVRDINTTVATFTIKTGNEHLVIGADNDYNQYLFAGKCNEVRIYNRALSANEILYLYAHPYYMFKY